MRVVKSTVAVAVALAVAVGLVGCGSGEDTVMPDVTGQQLDVALSDIERAGFGGEVEVLGGGMFGVVDESNWQVCSQLPAAGEVVTEAPRLEVDRSCGGETPEPEESEPEADSSVYDGPQYEVVAVNDTAVYLTEHWVYTEALDYSTEAYKDQIKLIVEDIARQEGTTDLIVQVVTDKEIALAESTSTYEAFIAEHGEDYAINEIPKKEVTGWVASYSGGYDYNGGELSDSADAYEILWFPYGDAVVEQWKPTID